MKKSTMKKSMKNGPSEVDPENVQPITKDQLKDSDKAEFEAHMKHYEELCLASYGDVVTTDLPTLGTNSKQS
jgi:hypothetical protein